jgi:hypothetical protein
MLSWKFSGSGLLIDSNMGIEADLRNLFVLIGQYSAGILKGFPMGELMDHVLFVVKIRVDHPLPRIVCC